jgi:hypothetical protein
MKRRGIRQLPDRDQLKSHPGRIITFLSMRRPLTIEGYQIGVRDREKIVICPTDKKSRRASGHRANPEWGEKREHGSGAA